MPSTTSATPKASSGSMRCACASPPGVAEDSFFLRSDAGTRLRRTLWSSAASLRPPHLNPPAAVTIHRPDPVDTYHILVYVPIYVAFKGIIQGRAGVEGKEQACRSRGGFTGIVGCL